jgi:type IV secretory pathway VirB4 component
MTKVVRAFSLDPAVSEDLDWHTSIPGVLKPMNKSKYVNEALKFYMGKNIKEMIEQNRTLKENLTAGLRSKDVIIQGLEQQVALLSDHRTELMAQLDCRCLWCRLKKRLQK